MGQKSIFERKFILKKSILSYILFKNWCLINFIQNFFFICYFLANNIFHMFSQDFERNFNFTSPTSSDPDAPVIPDIFSQTQNSEKDSSSYHWEIPPAPLVFEENYSSTFKTPQFDF